MRNLLPLEVLISSGDTKIGKNKKRLTWCRRANSFQVSGFGSTRAWGAKPQESPATKRKSVAGGGIAYQPFKNSVAPCPQPARTPSAWDRSGLFRFAQISLRALGFTAQIAASLQN
jgi:hypothetical protein